MSEDWLSFAALYRKRQKFTPAFSIKDQITVFAWRFMRRFKISPTVANFDIWFDKFAKRFHYSYSRYHGRFSKTFLDQYVCQQDILEPFLEHGNCTEVLVNWDIIYNRRKKEQEEREQIRIRERERIYAILNPPPKPTHVPCIGCGRIVKSNSLKECYIRGAENNGYKCMSCWNKTKPLAKLANEIADIKTLTNTLQKLLREKNHGKPNKKHNRSTSQNVA